MVGYDNDNNALTLGDDDSLSVGDYELEYNSTDDQWQARYGRPIGGEVGNHGDIEGGAGQYSTESKIGDSAFDFSRNGDINIDILQFPQDHSWSVWIKTSSHGINDTRGLIMGNGEDTRGSYIGISDGHAYWRGNSDPDMFGNVTNTVNDDVWHHVVATIDQTNTTVKLYIDGTEVQSEPLDNVVTYGGRRIEIGSRGDNDDRRYEGLLDDARLYNKVLTASEVSDLFSEINVTSGLVSRWDFEYPETPDRAIDSTGDVYPKNSVPRSTTDTLVPQGLAESVFEGKALADDGEMYDSVQEAVDNADGWVFVGPGTFNESVTIDTEGLTLEGSGYDTVIDGGASGNAIQISSADNVTIRNLSLQTTAGSGNAYDCIQDNGATSVTIDSVHIRESDRYGILFGNVSGVDWSIRNCTITDTGDSSIDAGASNYIITNCTIRNSSNFGIDADGDDGIISNNVIDGSNQDGIILRGANDSITIGNRVINSGDEGIEIFSDATDCIVANNRVSDSVNDDIYDQGTGTELDDNLTGASN